MTIATSLTSSHGQSILWPFLLRETERHRETERENEERENVTNPGVKSSFYKCIWLIFWGPNVTRKPKGPAGAQQCVKPRHSVVLVWPTMPCPELGRPTEAAFHGSAPLAWALWLLHPWEGKLAAQTPSSIISFNSSLPLYHLICKHFTFKTATNWMTLPHFCKKRKNKNQSD